MQCAISDFQVNLFGSVHYFIHNHIQFLVRYEVPLTNGSIKDRIVLFDLCYNMIGPIVTNL